MILRPPSDDARRMYVRLFLDADRPRCPWCGARKPCTDADTCDEARAKRLEDA